MHINNWIYNTYSRNKNQEVQWNIDNKTPETHQILYVYTEIFLRDSGAVFSFFLSEICSYFQVSQGDSVIPSAVTMAFNRRKQFQQHETISDTCQVSLLAPKSTRAKASFLSDVLHHANEKSSVEIVETTNIGYSQDYLQYFHHLHLQHIQPLLPDAS